MRLKRNRLKPYTLKPYKATKGAEGQTIEGYDEAEKRVIRAEIWPAGGKLQAELYGNRLSYVLNCLVDKGTVISERDGLCIDSEDVTHKVISKKVYTNHVLLELEACRN